MNPDLIDLAEVNLHGLFDAYLCFILRLLC